MEVRKVRGKNKIGKITLYPSQIDILKKFKIPVDAFVNEHLIITAKQRKWKWFFEKEKNNE
jgi:hypothetical protein